MFQETIQVWNEEMVHFSYSSTFISHSDIVIFIFIRPDILSTTIEHLHSKQNSRGQLDLMSIVIIAAVFTKELLWMQAASNSIT